MSVTCAAKEFYDAFTRQCQSCASVCEPVHDTAIECGEKCLGYLMNLAYPESDGLTTQAPITESDATISLIGIIMAFFGVLLMLFIAIVFGLVMEDKHKILDKVLTKCGCRARIGADTPEDAAEKGILNP